MTRQKDIDVPQRAMDLCSAFDEFMRRKPKRMRNAYWKAFSEGWKKALDPEIKK